MAVNNEHAFDHQRLEVAAAALKPNLPQNPVTTRIYFTVETSAIRYRYDGGSPTSGAGHLAASGSAWSIDGIDNCRNLSFISTSGTAIVTVTLETS